MKKILITGGLGYIGSHTTVVLQQAGYEVLIIDNLSNSSKLVLNSIEKITGIKPYFENFDLCDFFKLRDFFRRNTNIEGVIHFAAYKAVGESVSNPLGYYRNNLSSTINILECLNENNIPSFVFSSSCCIYGQPKNLPVTEDSPIQLAQSPYGNTKQICEEIIQDTVKATKLKSISLRYFNPVGAHKSKLLGEVPNGTPNNLVPYIMQTAVGKLKKLKVFGKNYNTVDGTGVRDYIHVEDLASAHLKAIERLLLDSSNNNYEYFNLGTGNGYSVLQIIDSFEKISGRKLNYQIVTKRDGDIAEIWADTTKANNILKWKAELTLDNMISSAWEWELMREINIQ